jgi:hypothetical protein
MKKVDLDQTEFKEGVQNAYHEAITTVLESLVDLFGEEALTVSDTEAESLDDGDLCLKNKVTLDLNGSVVLLAVVRAVVHADDWRWRQTVLN